MVAEGWFAGNTLLPNVNKTQHLKIILSNIEIYKTIWHTYRPTTDMENSCWKSEKVQYMPYEGINLLYGKNKLLRKLDMGYVTGCWGYFYSTDEIL